jgi:putative FmdB family regulatory protein
MPTYEYHCDACEHNFDEFQSMSEPALTKCPKCGKKKLRRVFGTGAAILFKGSGFYQTDYRSESYKSAAKADQEAASKGSDASGSNGSDGTNTTGKTEKAAKGAKGEQKSSKS